MSDIDLVALTNRQAGEIAELKREIYCLHEQLANDERSVEFPYWAQYEVHRAYLLGKIQRQADYIRKIQKVGWQPSFIIREQPDIHDVETERQEAVTVMRRQLRSEEVDAARNGVR